jgi:hypothetical protein
MSIETLLSLLVFLVALILAALRWKRLGARRKGALSATGAQGGPRGRAGWEHD